MTKRADLLVQIVYIPNMTTQAKMKSNRNNRKNTRAPKTSQITRTKNAIINATVELLGEVSYGRMTVDLIADRSGISRSTIYRYWKSLPEIVSEAFDTAIGPEPELQDLGDIRAELIQLYKQAPDTLDQSIWGRILPSLIVASNHDGDFSGRLQKITHERRENVRNLIRRSIERGELKADTDIEWMIDMLSSIFYHRRYITGGSMHSKGLVEKTVDAVLNFTLIAPKS